MGKRKGKKKESILNTGLARSLREEGKGVLNVSSSTNANIIKKMQHLQRLAVWAAGEGGIPPIGALLGVHLASTGEVSGIPPPDSSFFTCERCETILQPGINCSVRVLNQPQKAWHKPCAFSKFINFCLFMKLLFTQEYEIWHSQGVPQGKTLEMPTFAIQKNSEKNIIFKQTQRRLFLSRHKEAKCSISASSPLMFTNLPSTTVKRKHKGLSTLKELANGNQRSPSSGNSPSTPMSGKSS